VTCGSGAFPTTRGLQRRHNLRLRNCNADAISQANDTLGNSMLVAGAVGVPVFFILLLTIGTSQDTFSDLGSILEQVASYQLIGSF
jgi:hypothetical protein